MRRLVLGLAAVAILTAVAIGVGAERGDLTMPRSPALHVHPNLANADMIVASSNVGDKFQQLSLVDTKNRVISVYQVEYATGEIALKSVRSFQFDQQMTQFHTKEPLPEEIKALLPPK